AAAAAAVQWPRDGTPHDPGAWLVRVASRRLLDGVRADRARSAREERLGRAVPDDGWTSPSAEQPPRSPEQDTLQLALLCCHPSLSRPSQVALTLRSVTGLGVQQIAAAFLVPERTLTQRLTRARATLRAAGARFSMPSPAELPARVGAVLDVCHLTFNEGYTRSSGDQLVDALLAEEAIALVRRLRRALPDHDEVAGLLALVLLTHARTPARTDARGDLVPLAEQDRTRWDHDLVAEGIALLERVLPRGPVGRYQLQAAIAAVHAEAAGAEQTDWEQIRVLYEMLERIAPGPAVTLNKAVAVGMARGAEHGLAVVEPLLEQESMRHHHRTHAVRAHLLERAGRVAEAADSYRQAARLTASTPEQRYLNARLRRLDGAR
uniref:RNA polymerase sigma factor n=1 Tax=Desertihabitans aurantiacus TaxID=2282477 RepID=UPI001E623F10